MNEVLEGGARRETTGSQAGPLQMPVLDAMRFGAALLVLLNHLRIMQFRPFTEITGGNGIFNQAFFMLTRVGLEAVVLFFVLSGYLVGGASIQKALAGNFNIRKYFIDRFARIYVPLVPSLALTIGILIWYRVPFSWIEAGLNLLSLQGAFAEPFSGNTALWSLSYELWFYIGCGACLGLLSSGSLLGRIGFLVLAALAALVFSKLMIAYLIAWLIGVGAAFLTRPKAWVLWLLGLIATSVGIVLMQLSSSSEQVNLKSFQWIDRSLAIVVLAVGFGLIVAACARIRIATARLSGAAALCAALASFSYTLYLIHNPLIFVLEQQGMLPKYSDVSVLTVGIFAGTALSIIAVAFIWYLLFERHTPSFRSFAYRHLLRKPSSSPPPVTPVEPAEIGVRGGARLP